MEQFCLRDALETTMLGNASFMEAEEYGLQELRKYWDALYDGNPWNSAVGVKVYGAAEI